MLSGEASEDGEDWEESSLLSLDSWDRDLHTTTVLVTSVRQIEIEIEKWDQDRAGSCQEFAGKMN